MTTETVNTRAQLLRSYHDNGAPVLVLPNAWDAGSARVIAAAGARAVATSSGGVAWSLGRPDGQQLTRTEMVEAVRRIAATVDLPVTADIEAGYGATAQEVSDTVHAVIRAGAAGINLEDSRAPGGPLFAADQQAERISAARAAARSGGAPDLVVNARTDVYLCQIGPPTKRRDESLARADAYAAAGADCLFVPGLSELAELERLVASSPLPVNAMAVPGGPTVAELSAVGVRRVSVGTWLAQAAYTRAHQAAVELLTAGTYGRLDGVLDYADLNRLYSGAGPSPSTAPE